MTIRPELSSLAVSISKIKPHPNNVRQGDIGAICQSLSEHGQYRPIVVQKKTGFILAGNHTFQAAKSLGWKEIAATFVECDEEQALRILLVDNRTNDLAMYDQEALADLLAQLATTEDLLTGTGYTAEFLDELTADLETTLSEEFEKLDTNIATEHQCPKCGYEWSGKAK